MKLSKKEWIAVVVALIIVIIFFFPFFSETFFPGSSVTSPEELVFPANNDIDMNDNTSAVQTRIIIRGDGEVVTSPALVAVHYVGRLENGDVFDSSRERNVPFQFILGAGQVIPGLEEGMEGMRVGEQREVRIPAASAYGSREITNPQNGEVIIPANSNLVFEVELLEAQNIEAQQ